jgi:exodeoxyribonuclease VII small subunit
LYLWGLPFMAAAGRRTIRASVKSRAIFPRPGRNGGHGVADYNQRLNVFVMAKTSSTAQTAAAPANYEEALGELDRLVQSMEAGQLPLDRLLESYKRGAELLNSCRTRLEAVEQQVKVLEDGQLKPWTTE